MSVNVYKPHLLVLPEDGANRQMANGFLLDDRVIPRNIQVLQEAGGWAKVLGSFLSREVEGLRQYSERHLLLLIDFDGQFPMRSGLFKEQFPPDVQDRVYLLGTAREPEVLKTQRGKSLESIGQTLADECAEQTSDLWNDVELAHNASERSRLMSRVSMFIFK